MLRLRVPLAFAVVALTALPVPSAPALEPDGARAPAPAPESARSPAPDAAPAIGDAVVPSAAVNATRLRTSSPRLRRWLARGVERSPTLRALARQVERGDVIVYLEMAYDLDAGMAACVTWMASVPGARYVRVSLRPNLRETDATAMLAHELQHVVEVIEHPEVTSGDTLAALYARIGHRTGALGVAWDTLAALRAGDSARLELVRGT